MIKPLQIEILQAVPFSFLPLIGEFEGMSQEELSEKLYLDKTTVARGLSKLLKGGYIIKKQDEYDKRVYRIFLTDTGKEIVPFIKEVRAAWTEALSSEFTEEEKREMLALLKKVVENALKFKDIGFF